MRRPLVWTAFAAILAAAAVVRGVYAARLGPPVRGDEAVNALTALRIFRGEDAPLFLYGVDYLSSLEAWAAAAAWGVVGIGDVSFRILPFFCSTAAVGVFVLLARRLFGVRVALAAAPLLALPPFFILHLGAIAIGGYAEGLFLGLGLWLAFATLRRRERTGHSPSAAAYAAFSALVGVSWWIYPMVLGFLLPIALVWLRHPEGVGSARFPWRAFLWPRDVLPEPGWNRLLCALQAANAGVAALVLWILITGGGALRWGDGSGAEIGLSNAAKVAFWNVALSCLVAGIVWWRRGVFPVTRGFLALSAGIALGKGFWILERLRASETVDTVHLRFKLAQGFEWLSHLRALWTEILPGFAGLPGTPTRPGETAWALAAVAAAAFLLVPPARRFGRGVWNVTRLAPGPEDLRAAFLSMLVLIPILNIVRGGAGMPVRYWTYLFPALAAALAIGARAAWRRGGWRRAAGVCAVALLVGGSFANTLRGVAARTPFSDAKQRAVLARLPALGVAGGYAEYDLATSLSFLSGERFVFVPFDYRSRVPGQAERIAALPRHAYLFHADPDSTDRLRAAAFRARARAEGRPIFAETAGGVEILVVEGPPMAFDWDR